MEGDFLLYISEVRKLEDLLTEKQSYYPNVIKKIIYFFNVNFRKINYKLIENNEIIYLSNKSIKHLAQYLKDKKERIVCLSENILERKDVVNLLTKNQIKILDGRWLFNYISIKVVEYILLNQNKSLKEEEIAILTNTTDEVILDTICELAKHAKAIHIITEDRSKFKNIETKLYDEYGIIVNVSNNYRKSLSNVNIIVNFNFSEELLNKYKIPRFSVIINIKEKVKIYSKAFEGLNINYYQIFMPKNYVKYIKYFANFDQTVLYESFIYRKDTYKNIINKIYEDNIRICTLVGDNGNIKKYEYERLNKNKLDNKRKYVKNSK